MKILLANKFYYRRGGDCIYVLNLEQILKENGHDVAVFAMQYPDNLPTQWSNYFPSEVKFSPGVGIVESFLRPFGTKEVKQKFTALLEEFQPDVVHLNNIHSQLSPVIAEIAHKKDIRVVWTLHDYKLLCPRYDCLRNGEKSCEKCFSDKKKVLQYRCMKNSALASRLSYWETRKWNKENLESFTDTFICPSRFMAAKMPQGGFDSHKLITLHNFIETEKCQKENYNKEEYYCYVGRLSHEKGIKTLIKAAQQLPYTLKIVGDGPLKKDLQDEVKGTNIEFIGYKQWPEIKEIVGKARFMVTPSEWYENNPLSVLEALCLGTPVLGSRIGGIPELIEENKNGILFETGNGNDLKNKIEYCWNEFSHFINYKEIAIAAQQKYSAEKYYKEIMTIYQHSK